MEASQTARGRGKYLRRSINIYKGLELKFLGYLIDDVEKKSISYNVKLLILSVCTFILKNWYIRLKKKLRGLSPQTNYTDRAATAGRRN